MEARGYSLAIAQIMKMDVYLVEMPDKLGAENKYSRFSKDNKNVLQIRLKEEGEWINVSACLRMLKSKPWNRITLPEKDCAPCTQFINPLVIDLAGGKDKGLASKAYEFYNARNKSKGKNFFYFIFYFIFFIFFYFFFNLFSI